MSSMGNFLLDALSAGDLAILRPRLTRVKLVSDTVLQKAGEIIEHVYFPVDGMISLVAQLESGDGVEIAAIGHEGAVGAKVGRHPQLAFAGAVVQLPGAALRTELASFQAAAKESVGITHIATSANDVVVANLQQSAACNAYHGVEERLARWLLQASDHFEGDVLPLTQQFLSQMLGARRTTVQLAAATLSKHGAIDYRRGKIRLRDRAALENISCECYRAVTRNIRLICEMARA